MTKRASLPWPIWMLALDVVGTLFLALGLFGRFGGLAPDSIDAANARTISVSLVIIGALLMLPFLVTVIRQVLGGNRTG